jgi:hypothetical protein
MRDTKQRTSSHETTNLHQDTQKVPFNNALWREILNSTTDEVNSFFNLDIETISPFGFEVLMDKRFLHGILRRFYCYLGTKKSISDDTQLKIIRYFYEKLMQKLSIKYPALFSSIVLVVMKDDFLYLVDDQYICKSTDKLIDIQFRQVNTNILDDYSNYVIASLDGLIMEKGEVKGYRDRAINRWRFYQLYIMQEELYRQYSPRMTTHEIQLFKNIPSLASNMIKVFFDSNSVNQKISTYEESLFQELILPRVNILYKVASGNSENIMEINSSAYHVKDDLSLNIDKEIYQDIMLKIKNTYNQYL